jgi:hypothetical protein
VACEKEASRSRWPSNVYSVQDAYIYGFALQEKSLPFDDGEDSAAVAEGKVRQFAELAEEPQFAELGPSWLNDNWSRAAGSHDTRALCNDDAYASIRKGQAGSRRRMTSSVIVTGSRLPAGRCPRLEHAVDRPHYRPGGDGAARVSRRVRADHDRRSAEVRAPGRIRRARPAGSGACPSCPRSNTRVR